MELHPEAEVRLVQRQSHRDEERQSPLGVRQSQDARLVRRDRLAPNLQSQDA